MRKSGEERWKKDRACDWTSWPRFTILRSLRAVSGISTASSASVALAEARRCETGQMPQMRAVMTGISRKLRPSQNFSNPRNSTTWKRASFTAPASSSWMVTFA